MFKNVSKRFRDKIDSKALLELIAGCLNAIKHRTAVLAQLSALVS